MDEPALLSLALSPNTDADRERLTLGLRQLMAEDPSLRLNSGVSTGEVVIAATSELQLEIVVDRLGREFNRGGRRHGLVGNAFKVAGAMAFRDAARKAAPVLLEPVMGVDVAVSNEFAREVEADLKSRSGDVHSRQDRGGTQIIRAHVSLAELFACSSSLKERTRGLGDFVMQFERYQPVRPAEDDGTQASFVRAPRRPTPTPRSSGVALPEAGDGSPEVRTVTVKRGDSHRPCQTLGRRTWSVAGTNRG